MSLQASAPPASNGKRPLAEYHATVWGDHFANHASHPTVMSPWDQQFTELKEVVVSMLSGAVDHEQKLRLVDDIQRLGIAYHFQAEIDQILQNIYDHSHNQTGGDDVDDDLSTVSLQFRLLRQQGYNVSCDVFNKFKDENGEKFRDDIGDDVEAMLSLYEASHLSIHGEKILDEALAFTTAQLGSIATQLSPSLAADRVSRALKNPLRRAVTRQEAWHYISFKQQLQEVEEEGHNAIHDKALLNLAKLDFNTVQKLQQEELSDITRWWKELDLARKLPYIRDRVIECYIWPIEVFVDPKFSFGRKMLTKVLAMISLIDDTYDSYGTIEELEFFTQMIERFENQMADDLPDYLKICYQALLDVLSEVEQEMDKEGKSYCLSHAKEGVKDLAKGYLVEARWCHNNYVPTMEEYIENGLITAAHKWLVTTSFCGMGGDMSSKEDFDWIFTKANMFNAASLICRIMNDIVSHKFEQNREHVASSVECYMKQYGVEERVAYDELNKILADAWKDINEGLLLMSPAAGAAAPPMALLAHTLKFARASNVVYKDEDGYTHSMTSLKKILSTLLLNPFAIN